MTLLLSCYEPSTFCLLGKWGHLKIVVLGYIYPSNRPAQLQYLFNLSKGRSSCRETLRPLAVANPVANPLLLHRQLQSTFQVMIELTLLFANLNNSQLPIPLHPPTCVYILFKCNLVRFMFSNKILCDFSELAFVLTSVAASYPEFVLKKSIAYVQRMQKIFSSNKGLLVNANTLSQSHGDSNDNINENPDDFWYSRESCFSEVSNISQLNVFHPYMFFPAFQFHTVYILSRQYT